MISVFRTPESPRPSRPLVLRHDVVTAVGCAPIFTDPATTVGMLLRNHVWIEQNLIRGAACSGTRPSIPPSPGVSVRPVLHRRTQPLQ